MADNIVQEVNSPNILVITDSDQNQVMVTQPLTNTIEVATPGPQGIVGPTGPAGPSTPFTKISGSDSWFTTSSVQVTGSLIVSGSSTFINIGPAIFTGSVQSTQGFTGSLQGSSSYALQTLSASYALQSLSSSYALQTTTASYAFQTLSASYAPGGGLTNFTEGFSSVSQSTSFLSASNATAHVNFAIIPKGTGSIIAAIPDGSSTNGNRRGAFSVDLLRSRNSATQVASGSNSILIGGENNTAAGNYSAVIGGSSNTINNSCDYSIIVGGNSNNTSTSVTYAFIGSGFNNRIFNQGSYSFIGGGQTNLIYGSTNTIVGGQNNQVSNSTPYSTYGFIGGGQNHFLDSTTTHGTIGGGTNNYAGGIGNFATVAGGQSNFATRVGSTITGGSTNYAYGDYSTIIGGYQGFINLYGQTAHASGQFSAAGDAQVHELIWRRAITGTAQTELFLDGSSAAAVLGTTNTLWHGILNVSAICTTAGNGTTTVGHVEATSYKVTIKRIGSTTSLVGTVQEIGTTNADATMSTAVFTVDNNDTNESLRIRFTPPSTAGSTTVIRCLASFSGHQLKY